MKLIVDMNLSSRGVTVLVDAGFEAAHWSTSGIASALDQMKSKLAEGALVTIDTDRVRLCVPPLTPSDR